MAGHSKWANIKHRKKAVDAKRSQHFQKITKEIKIAALTGGGDWTKNHLLKAAIQKAKELNVPKAVIQRAIESATASFQTVASFWLAGKFHKEVFLLFRLETTKKIAALNQLKKAVSKTYLEILPLDSILHFFEKVIVVEFNALSEQKLLSWGSEFEAFDFSFQPSQQQLFFSSKQAFKQFQTYLLNNQIAPSKIDQTYFPKIKIAIKEGWKEELLKIKETILSQTPCNLIVDNLE